MSIWIFLFFFFHSLPLTLTFESQPFTLSVKGSTLIAKTDDNYICATLDWWPPEKCNYNDCPWGMASVFNLDLKNPHLRKAIQAFKRMRIRIGGSLQDQLVYEVQDQRNPCPPFQKQASGMFGFSSGCLTRARWDEVNLLFMETGAVVTFGLNALQGRKRTRTGLWVGPWNSSNAQSFMEYTLSKGYPVDSWEFGNEVSGSGVGARVMAAVYAKDVIKLKNIVKNLYQQNILKPLVIAPGGFYEHKWYLDLIHASGQGVLDVISHHIYNLGAGNDPQIKRRMVDPEYLSQMSPTFQDLRTLIEQNGPWVSAWVSESGGAYNSGGRLVSDTFLDSFWYIDQLGMAAKYNTKAYCRQSLVGGNYGLLDLKTFIPNPDYYGALLWHRLMGKGVLDVRTNGSPFLRVYAHCAKDRDGISLALINLSNSTEFTVSVSDGVSGNIITSARHRESMLTRGLKSAVSWVGKKAWQVGEASTTREEYHLVGKDGAGSKKVVLNGVPLEIGSNGDIPAMDPLLVHHESPIEIMPMSIVFIVFPDFDAPSCS